MQMGYKWVWPGLSHGILRLCENATTTSIKIGFLHIFSWDGDGMGMSHFETSPFGWRNGEIPWEILSREEDWAKETDS